MVSNKIKKTNKKMSRQKIVIIVMQLMIMMNANILGWTVESVTPKRLIFTKKIKNLTFLDDNLNDFIINVMPDRKSILN